MTKIIYRPHRLAIDIAKPGLPALISVDIQRLELGKDNEVIAITGYQDTVHIRASEVATDTVDFTDPVTDLSGSISVASLDHVLKVFSNRWVARDLACEIDTETGWPINCQNIN